MARLTLAIVVQTLFGADVTRDAKEVGGLMVAVLDAANDRLNSVLRLPSWVPTRRNRKEKRALRRLDQLLNRFIAEHRASRDAPGSPVGSAGRDRRRAASGCRIASSTKR
jgi:cytochrome P450